MRTTMNTIYSKIQTNLGKITKDMSKINEQISSGQQMNTLSDSPVNLVNALRFRSSVVELDQYTENIQNGNTIINAAESALSQMKELALRAKTLSIQATDPGNSAANRESIAIEVQNLFEQAVYLANTQINGKYIFGGSRTTGYTDQEPAPFIVDKGDGHWINGTAPAAVPLALSSKAVESAATTTDLIAGDLLINGVDIGAVDLTTTPDVAGVNMQGAWNLKEAINLHAGLHAGSVATADPLGGTGSQFDFELNGTSITVIVPDGSTAAAVSAAAIAAINLKAAETGVTALPGDGTNGPLNSVVFSNTQPGDNATITVANFTATLDGGAALGFTDFSQKIVSATLTTQGAGAASAGATGNELVDFTINGVRIAYTATLNGATAAAQQAIDAINAVQEETGVTALLGTGTNGGPADAIILQNTLAGDETDIVVAGITSLGIPLPHAAPYDEKEITGLSNLTYSVGAGNNTGQISLSSDTTIDIDTSAASSTLIPKDTILNRIGLGGGGAGNFDAAGDGKLVYGYPLTAGELKVNGIEVPATTTDGLSQVYADASAAAKAAAINSIESQTGVTAVVVNAETQATGAVTAGTEASRPTGLVSNTVIRANELSINGILLGTEISSGTVTNGLNMEKAFNAKTAINVESLNTKVLGRLTTLLPKPNLLDAATAGVATNVSFKINGTDITVTTGGISGNKTATDVVAAINLLKGQSGVEARVGDGTNGGVSNSIVLFNTIKGNEDAIIVTGIDSPSEDFLSLGNNGPGGQAADIANNTGEISLDSKYPVTIATPTISPGADVVINELGFSSKNVTGFGGQTSVTATVTGVPIAANALYVNGMAAGAIAGGAPTNGVNMDMAASAKTQIEAADPNVHVRLTTMTQGGVGAIATSTATADSNISFKVNGESVTLSYPDTTPDTDIAFLTVQAINSVTTKTGVQAYIGTGANDGSAAGSAAANVIVFRNLTSGNDAAITVSEMTVNYGNNNLGFGDFSQTADATHNAGEITISSATTFDLSTPLTLNDSILNQLGLGYNALTGYSEKDNGIYYSSDGTGEGQASFGASPAFMSNGDLLINGTEIFTTPTAVLKDDQTNTVIDAINAQTATTGVQATRGSDGIIRLAATDGRNIHLQTSMNGETITHLTGGSRDQVSFGSLQLRSDRKFILETVDPSVNGNEPGLATLGLAGGETTSGEPDDVAGDGKIDVFSIHDQSGSVRYAGDRVNDLEIKIGKATTMTIGDNGMTGVMDTSIFGTLKALQNYLLNTDFTTVTGIHSATDTSVLLNSKTTGLEPASQLPTEDLFHKGSFTVSVIDNDYHPPRTTPMTIAIDPSVDTLESVGKRIDGIPHINASWSSDGHLKIASSDPGRYTIALHDIDSNFLDATGVSTEFMQYQGITQSIADLDTLMENLSRQVSNFGARANRIDVQSQIYTTMTIATKENLSEAQDTDMIKAVMDLKAKETAYQAALSAAAKTMQLSLVDYLK